MAATSKQYETVENIQRTRLKQIHYCYLQLLRIIILLFETTASYILKLSQLMSAKYFLHIQSKLLVRLTICFVPPPPHTHKHLFFLSQFGVLVSLSLGMYLTSGIWSMIKSSQVEEDVRTSLINSANFYETNRVYNSTWNALHTRVSLVPQIKSLKSLLLILGQKIRTPLNQDVYCDIHNLLHIRFYHSFRINNIMINFHGFTLIMSPLVRWHRCDKDSKALVLIRPCQSATLHVTTPVVVMGQYQ